MMLSRTLNFTDRLYLVFFATVSVLVMLRAHRVPAWPILWTNVICVALVLLLARNAFRSAVWRFLHDWYPLAIFIVCFEEVSRLSFLFVDGWQDHYLLAVESRIFSVPPTVWLGRLGTPLVTEILEVGYFSYFVLLMIVGGVFYRWRDRRPFRQVMDASVLSYMMCYVIFILFPTEGPAHTLAAQHNFPLPGGGPFHWAVLLIQGQAGVHGNAFPSAHVAAAAVALVFAWRYAPKLGLALTPLVVLLCTGAVYDRYHYVSDVVMGIPFGVVPALVILAVAQNQLPTK